MTELNGGAFARGSPFGESRIPTEEEELLEAEEYEEAFYRNVLVPEARIRMWNMIFWLAFAIILGISGVKF